MDLLIDGPDAAPTLVLAHGAGAAMDSPGMSDLASRIAARGVRVVRFEFAYMASRRIGVRRPPPRADTLLDEYRAVLAEVGGRPVIGGRSMGGRVASMIADAGFAAGSVAGLVCLSYPWHPPAASDRPRIEHLADLTVPTLIVQGTRDPFGSPAEVAGYGLSSAIEVLWLEDGDHDLRPRKTVSGFTYAGHLDSAADAVAVFVSRVVAAG
ncbi:alpha/beta fold hydrolase [Pseudolysinimonas sp.]|uniref:alpha/beta fold hydrolase n=1 Tax=Pseudolysinimonas sp. TaxID=2680009 RepID=UPI00286B4427|nr:alpha/beta family hydrolase [Pseudolysinimonas sp.]